MPLRRRIPKRGFHNPSHCEFAVVNVEMLNGFAAGRDGDAGTVACHAAWCGKLRAPIKILGDGDLKAALTVRAHKFSKSAEEKITRAGGKVEILP